MTHPTLKETCETIHLGGFSATLKPALIVQSGDLVQVETFSGCNAADQAPPAFVLHSSGEQSAKRRAWATAESNVAKRDRSMILWRSKNS